MSIELAWMLAATSGLLVSLWSLIDAHGGVQRMRNKGRPEQIVARGYRRGEALTAIAQAILFALGVSPLLNPEPVRLSLFVAALMTVNVILLTRSVFDARDRLLVRRELYRPPERD